MKQAFIAVIIELWEFVFGRTVTPEQPKAIPSHIKIAAVPPLQSKPPLTPLAYVMNTQVPLLVRAVVAFDTKVKVISFPKQVKVLRTEGDYSHVVVDDTSGWVLSIALESDYKRIQPHLTVGVVYDAGHEETVKLRQLLHDECLGGVLQLPLQSTEFILWRLLTVTTAIDWGIRRPRLPGTWQSILKGKSGIHIGIEPKTNAVMEYFSESGKGILGFVSAVHPDQSIVVQSVGQGNEGEYFEETLSVKTWREWRPVFISFL